MSNTNTNIELKIIPKEKDLGDNFIVRRSLPDARKKTVGPFIFWDHMGPVTLTHEKEMKVRSHPHIGLATITYLFTGEILHRDSLGNEQTIRPGEVNWMTAGSGITHSERSKPEPGEKRELEGIQLWLALPKESEEVAASFFHCKEKDLPQFSKEGTELTLVAGEAYGEKSPVPVYSNLFYFSGKIKTGSSFSYSLNENEEGAVYITKGSLEIEGESAERYSLTIFKKGTAINFLSHEDSEFMIFGGEIFPEKRHIFWNFVSSDPERIEKAKKDWREGKFSKTIKETEFIPLPE